MSLAVSILADEFTELARRALLAAASADLIELRLDRLTAATEPQLADLIARLGKPVVVAVNGLEAYGTFAGSSGERNALLQRAARAGAAFVDIDWRQAAQLSPLPGATRRVVSRHEREPRGSARDLERELRACARPGDLCKLVVEARRGVEALELLDLLVDAPGDLIAFASGAAGSFSRVLAPILGSPWTFAAADPQPGEALPSTAPGQLSVSQMRAAWPMDGPRAATAIFAVVGRPIAHSISPRVHTAGLRVAGIDAVFVAVELEELAPALALLRAGSWRGLAVTAPHKEAAFAISRGHDAASRRARACNTLLRETGGWRGANTDATAVQALLARAQRPLSRALVLGAGGAARAALTALEAAGIPALLSARDGERSQALAAEFGQRAVPWQARERERFDVLLQCTSCAEALFAEAAIPADALVIESIYRPSPTALQAAAQRRGARTCGGAEWFLEQARLQFELFNGRSADQRILREALRHALA